MAEATLTLMRNFLHRFKCRRTSVATTAKQITTTTQTNPGDVVNVWDFGRRMSLDGRYIAFDSYAELEPAGSGASQSAFALYLYDTAAATNPFRRIGPKSDADSAAGGGDVAHYPGFTDYSISGAPATLVFTTRLNIKADGTVAATQADGLTRSGAPVQIYSYPLIACSTATFTRLTKFPALILFWLRRSACQRFRPR